MIYVGETTVRLRARLQQHLYAIYAAESRTLVATHLKEHAVGGSDYHGLASKSGMVGQSAEKDEEGMDRQIQHLCSIGPECTCMRCGL